MKSRIIRLILTGLLILETATETRSIGLAISLILIAIAFEVTWQILADIKEEIARLK